jgi:hypothetical protein
MTDIEPIKKDEDLPEDYRRVSGYERLGGCEQPMPGVGPALSVKFDQDGHCIGSRASEDGDVRLYKAVEGKWVRI